MGQGDKSLKHNESEHEPYPQMQFSAIPRALLFIGNRLRKLCRNAVYVHLRQFSEWMLFKYFVWICIENDTTVKLIKKT